MHLDLAIEMKSPLVDGFALSLPPHQDAAHATDEAPQHRVPRVERYSDVSTRRIESANCSQLFVSACSRRRPAGVIG
jgi:hypothetical protein